MTIALLRKRKSAIRQGIDLLRKLGDRASVFVPGVASVSGAHWINGASLTPTSGIQSIGPELAINGDFSNGTTGWTLWQPTVGIVQAEAGGCRIRSTDGSFAQIQQSGLMLSIGSTYRITFTVKGWVGGRLAVTTDGTNTSYLSAFGPGTYTFDTTVTSVGVLQFKRPGGETCDLIVDDVSCKLVTTMPTSAWLMAYVESGAATPASVDGPIGFLSDGEGVVGPVLIRSGLGLNGNTDNGDGTFTALSSTGNAIRIYFGLGDLVQGASYLVTLNILSAGTITADWCDVTSSVTVLAVTPGKSVTFISSRSTYDATYRFLDVLSNSGNVRFSYSVQLITGKHATQITGANKPPLRRGITNIFTYSSDFTNAAWLAGGDGAFAVTPNAGADPFGGNTASAFSGTFVTAGRQIYQTKAVVNSPMTTAVWMRTTSGTKQMRLFLNDTQITQDVTVTTQWTPFLLSGVVGASLLGSGRCGLRNLESLSGDLLVCAAGCFMGILSAAQISAMGGVPLTTSANASSANGSFSLEFYGGPTALTLPSVPIPSYLMPHSVVVGARCRDSTTTRMVFMQRSSSQSNPIVAEIGFASGVPRARWRTDSGAVCQPIHSATILEPCVLTATCADGVAALRVNGAQSASLPGPSSATTVDAATIGWGNSAGTAVDYFAGSLYAVVIVNSRLSAAELLVLERFVGALTGPTGVKF